MIVTTVASRVEMSVLGFAPCNILHNFGECNFEFGLGACMVSIV